MLVTGGAGFIGSNFIEYWTGKYPKDKIINLDKLTYAGNLDNLKKVAGKKNYSFVKGDICDQKLVDKLVAGVDVIVHFAAESHVDRSLTDPEVFLKTNILGTFNLLNAADKYKIKRFHHVSTDEVFGELELGTTKKFNEKTAYDPRSPYSASKASSDHLVRAYFHSFGVPITISNCSNNFGPYQNPEKFIPRMITNLIEGKNIPIYGDGKYVRDWLYVEDHCRAIELIVKKGKAGETYCVGGGRNDVNNLKLAKIILKTMGMGEDRIEFVTDREGHDRRYAIDWSKIERELGWQPKYNLEKGLKITIDWYKNNLEWWKKLKIEAENFYKNKKK